MSVSEIIYKLSKSRVKHEKKIEPLTKIVTSQVGLVFNQYLTQAQFRHHFTESNKLGTFIKQDEISTKM